jgi:hypothetical protein
VEDLGWQPGSDCSYNMQGEKEKKNFLDWDQSSWASDCPYNVQGEKEKNAFLDWDWSSLANNR